ncbi:MAG: hypothetical protein GX862_08765, partial [Leucobacter sp.]|nr:hypothetical protein [Leucobacter sp.]
QGYVISFTERSEFAGELQQITEIVGAVPPLTHEIWQLARSTADRAGGSANDILRLAIPKRMVRAETQHLAGTAPDPSADDLALAVSEDEQKTVDLLISGARLAVSASHGPERLPTGEWVGSWAVRLARLALGVHASGRSVILVAPDYRDVDQLHDALAAFGHAGTVRVDSRQSGSARYAGFLRALDAQPRVILGNRSAIYAPAHKLGAVLMWDDGDPLLAEPLAPYVHARDAALIRSQQASNGPVGLVFASHSRSAEVQRLIELSYVQPETVAPRHTRVIAAESVQHGEASGGRVPEFAARTIREGLQHGPVLVQVATPGYAPVAVCVQCEERAQCGVCSGPLGFRTSSQLACRWCGEHARDWRCSNCGCGELAMRGAGSQRTVDQFAKQFAGVRIVLSDSEHPHERVDSRSVLVVATRGAEPIAAGGYRAVVLLDAERLLSIESLRAGEDCLRWWHNAAALAAEDARCVLAGGAGPVVQAFVTGRTEDWLRSELSDRLQLRYPPMVRVASVTGGPAEVERAITKLGNLPGVDVLGPTAVPDRTAQPQSYPHGGDGNDLMRAIVRFDYSQGAEVAKRLRGALVADAAGASARIAGRTRGRARAQALRLRFDDRGVFDG